MTTPLTAEDVALSSSVYWSHGDNVLATEGLVSQPYSLEALRAELNWFSLFAERICILDICLLNNPLLRELILGHGYDRLLREAVIVPLLRTRAADFRELHDQTIDDAGAFVRPHSVEYAEILDANKRIELAVQHQAAYEDLPSSFERTLLDPAFLKAAGLASIEPSLRRYLRSERPSTENAPLRRSDFFFFADRASASGQPAIAGRLKLLSSAIYNLSYAQSLQLQPALLPAYADALLRTVSDAADADLFAGGLSSATVLDRVDIHLDRVATLTPEEVVELRKHGAKYFSAAAAAARDRESPELRRRVAEELDSYLHALKNELALLAGGRSERYRRAQSQLRLVERTSHLGGIAVGILSSVAGAGILQGALVSMIWSVGTIFASKRLDASRDRMERTTRQAWDRSIQSLNDRVSAGEAGAGGRPEF